MQVLIDVRDGDRMVCDVVGYLCMCLTRHYLTGRVFLCGFPLGNPTFELTSRSVQGEWVTNYLFHQFALYLADTGCRHDFEQRFGLN